MTVFVFGVWLTLVDLSAQSLGELAAREAARRAAIVTPSRVYTNIPPGAGDRIATPAIPGPAVVFLSSHSIGQTARVTVPSIVPGQPIPHDGLETFDLASPPSNAPPISDDPRLLAAGGERRELPRDVTAPLTKAGSSLPDTRVATLDATPNLQHERPALIPNQSRSAASLGPSSTKAPHGAAPVPGVAARASALSVQVTARQTEALERADVTVAYVVDTDKADVSVYGGRVVVAGRRAGATQLVMVRPDSVETVDLLVLDAPRVVIESGELAPDQALTSLQTLYISETERFMTSIDVSQRSQTRTTEFHLADMTQTGHRLATDPVTSIPSIAFRVRDQSYDVTAFDSRVYQSPLTLDGISLRGIHVRRGALELHSGYTSPLLFQNVLLPSASEAAYGGSYRIGGPKSALLPSVYYFAGDRRYGGTPGAMGSLMYEYGARADRLHLLGEVGYGRKLGAAMNLEYAGDAKQLSLRARYQPTGFSAIGFSRPLGTVVDGFWTARAGPALTFNASGEFVDQQLPSFQQRNGTSTAGLRYRLGTHWAATAGATLSRFEADNQPVIKTITVPIGLSVDTRHFGAAGLYRRQQNTDTNLAGDGGRVSLRTKAGTLNLTGSVDYQQNAATVDLILRGVPNLARVFAELGLTAQTPEDIVRLLRDNTTLVALGLLEAPQVTVQPHRLQSAADVSWISAARSRQQLRLHLIEDRTQFVSRVRRTTLGTVTYSRRLFGGVDALGGVSLWNHQDDASPTIRSWSFTAGATVRFRGLPSLSDRRGAISGIVYRDDEATGTYAAAAPRVPGVRVLLDGAREIRTDAQGRFLFESAPSGEHRVDVFAPAADSVFFTTPSSPIVKSGGTVTIGMAYSPARVFGFVRDDAGEPIGGVTLRLAGSERQSTAVADSMGRYSFSIAPGDYVLELLDASLPPGYDAMAVAPHELTLLRGAPIESPFTVPANRSIAGVVRGSHPGDVLVSLVEANRTTRSGPDGSYVFRSLKPGHYTVAAQVDGVAVRRQVDVPQRPSLTKAADLDPSPGRPAVRR